MSRTRGYLLIADISGFTSFMAGSELEHSQLILNEILKQIIEKFITTFTLAEIEGDAVFVYAPVEKISRSEIILEIIESLYFEFRDNKTTLRRMMSCDCKACEMVLNLDLKFIVHSGEYVLNEVVGNVKPLGNAVNTVHRLLKNRVTETTGWNAYVLFTEESMNDIGFTLQDAVRITVIATGFERTGVPRRIIEPAPSESRPTPIELPAEPQPVRSSSRDFQPRSFNTEDLDIPTFLRNRTGR